MVFERDSFQFHFIFLIAPEWSDRHTCKNSDLDEESGNAKIDMYIHSN